MSPSIMKNGEPREIDLLAPWKTTDRLGAEDSAALDRLLAEDPALVRRLDAAVEERDATVDLNEALPTPSRASLDRLFERIEAEEAARMPRPAGALRWLAAKIAGFRPTTLAWAAAAAALVIALQAGLLTRAYLGGEGAYETASDGSSMTVAGTTALVAFQPAATAEQIAAVLKDARAEIVAGPKPGGVFVVRVSGETLAGPKLEAALKPLRDRADVVRLVTPGGR